MENADWGAASLIPTLLVFGLAIWTRRPIESLLSGALLGLAMLHGTGFVAALADTSVDVMTDPDVAWVILVCGLMGGVIGLLLRTAATRAFTNRIAAGVGSARGALLASWVLGIFMFVDDYLNSLAVGAAMRDITDRFQVARERLAYVVDSTAAPISVIIPYSTWGAFFGGLLVANGLAPEGEGLKVYISAIPYMFYAWAAVLIVPLVVWGVIPSLGAMRSADRRARETGVLVPPEAAHIEAANQLDPAQGGAGYGPGVLRGPDGGAGRHHRGGGQRLSRWPVHHARRHAHLHHLLRRLLEPARGLRHGDRRLQDHARAIGGARRRVHSQGGQRRPRPRHLRRRQPAAAAQRRDAARGGVRDHGPRVLPHGLELGRIRDRPAHRHQPSVTVSVPT
jgi:hypothetical protein